MATFQIKQRYNSTYDYVLDQAKRSGVYNERLASDGDSGLAYINILAENQIKRTSSKSTDEEKAQAEKNLATIANSDTRLLNTTDALTRINLDLGLITEEEFKSYFGGDKTFDETYGSVDNYFKTQRQRTWDKFVYDNMTNVQRFFNGVGYVTGELVNAPLSIIEGVLDLGAYVASGFGANEDIAKWQQKDVISWKSTLADYRRKNVDWDDRGGIWNVVGSLAEEVGKTLTTFGLNSVIAPISIGSKALHVGSAIYTASMWGHTGTDTLNRYGVGGGWLKSLQRLSDFAVTAAIELGTEQIFAGGPVYKGGLIKGKSAATAGGRFFKSMYQEGVEEIIAEVFQPIAQNLIQNGNLSELNLEEWGTNIAVSGFIGSVIGALGAGLELGSVDLTKVTGLKPGAKVTRAQVLAARELISASKKTFDHKLNSEKTKFMDKYNFSQEDMVKIEAGERKLTRTDATGKTTEIDVTDSQLSDYQQAVESDKQTETQYQQFIARMSEIYSAVGKDQFEAGFNLWAETQEAQRQVLQNYLNYAEGVLGGKVSADVQEATEQYQILKTGLGIGVTPILSTNMSNRQANFSLAVGKMTGAKVVFVNRYNTETNTPITNSSDAEAFERHTAKFSDGKTQDYIFIDAARFDQQSVEQNLKALAIMNTAKSFEGVKKGSKLYRWLKDTVKEPSDTAIYDVLYDILTNPVVAGKVFMGSKPAAREVIKFLKQERDKTSSKQMKRVYINLIWTMRKNIADNFPQKAKLLALKQLETGLTSDDLKLPGYEDKIEWLKRLDQIANETKMLSAIDVNTFTSDAMRAAEEEAFDASDDSSVKIFQAWHDQQDILDNIKSIAEQRIKLATDITLKKQRLSELEVELKAVAIELLNNSEKGQNKLVEEYRTLQAEIETDSKKLTELNNTIDSLAEQYDAHRNAYVDMLNKELNRTESNIITLTNDMTQTLVEAEPKNEQESAAVMYKKMSNVSTSKYPFYWGLITEEYVAENVVSDYQIRKDLLNKGFNAEVKGRREIILPNYFLDPRNYTNEFIQQLRNEFDKDNLNIPFAELLGSYLFKYYNGAIMLPSGAITYAIDYKANANNSEITKFINSKKGKPITADKLFDEEFKKKYKKLVPILEDITIRKVGDKKFDDIGVPKALAVYVPMGNIIYVRKSDPDMLDSIYHELTHALFRAFGLGSYGADGYVKVMLDDCSDDELRTIYTTFMRNNLLMYKLSLRELYSITPEIRQRLINQLQQLFYEFDFEENIAELSREGYVGGAAETFIKSRAFLNLTDSIVVTNKGFYGTGKLSAIKHYNSTKASDEINTIAAKNNTFANTERFKKDSDIRDNKPKSDEITIETAKTNANEFLKTNKLLIPVVSSNIQNVDNKIATALINPVKNASEETKNLVGDLKTLLSISSKSDAETLYLTIQETDKLSSEFKNFWTNIIHLNSLAIGSPMTLLQLRVFANNYFKNKEYLKSAPDSEIQFILESCFNCKTLQLKNGEDVEYWISTGFPMMCALANVSEKYKNEFDWKSLKTIDDVRTFVKDVYDRNNSSRNESNTSYYTDYQQLSDRLLYIEENIETRKGKEYITEALKYFKEQVKRPVDIKSFTSANELYQHLKNKITKEKTDINNDLNNLVNKANRIDPFAKEIMDKSMIISDNITTIDASGQKSRPIMPIILGTSETEIKLDETTLKQRSKTLNISSAFSKINNATMSKDGDELNVLENQGAEELGYDRVENGESNEPLEIAGLEQIKSFAKKIYGNNYKKDVINDLTNISADDQKTVSKYTDEIIKLDENTEFYQDSSTSTDLTTLTDSNIIKLTKYIINIAFSIGHHNTKTFTSYMVQIVYDLTGEMNNTIYSKINNIVKSLDLENNKYIDLVKKRLAKYVYTGIETDKKHDLNARASKRLGKKVNDYSSATIQKQLLEKEAENLKTKIFNKVKGNYHKVTDEYLESEYKKALESGDNNTYEKLEAYMKSAAWKFENENKSETKEKQKTITKKAQEVIKDKHKQSVETIRTEKNANTVLENQHELENNGVDPEVIESAYKVNKGESITKEQQQKLEKVVKQEETSKNARESFKQQKPTRKLETPSETQQYVGVKIKEWFFIGTKLKDEFLDIHEYQGKDQTGSKPSIIWEVKRSNNAVVAKILNDLYNELDKGDSNYMFALVWEIFNQINQTAFIGTNPNSEQNRLIQDDLKNIIYNDKVLDLHRKVEALKETSNQFAKALSEDHYIRLARQGIGLRAQLERVRKQFDIDESAIEVLTKAFSMADTTDVTATINTLIKDLEKAKAELEQQVRETEKLRKEYTDYEAKEQEYNEKIKALNEQLDRLKINKMANKQTDKEVQNLQSQIKEIEKKRNEAKANREKAEKNLEEQKKKTEDSSAAWSKIERIVTDLKSKDPKDRARAVAMLQKYSSTLPKSTQDALSRSNINKLVQETLKAHAKVLGLDKKGSKFLKALRRYRYVAMLSSPSTWVRNYWVNGLMKGAEALTEEISNWSWVQKMASMGIDFNKLTEDGATMTFTLTNDEGAIETYDYPYLNFDWQKIKLPQYVNAWIANDIFTEEVLSDKLGFGGAYGEFRSKKQDEKSLIDINKNEKENWLTKLGDFEQWILTYLDAKFTHPMVRRVFGQLILSNLDQLTTAIFTKAAMVNGYDIKSEEFKKTDVYKEVKELINIIRNNPLGAEKAFTRFVELIPEEYIERFKNAALAYSAKTYFHNNNGFGDWMRNLQENHPVVAIPITILIPFARMSYNVMTTMLDYGPSGFIKWFISGRNYKSMQKQLEALYQIANEELVTEITKYKRELVDVYNKILNQKVSESSILEAVTTAMTRYAEDTNKLNDPNTPDNEKPKRELTEEQYNQILEVYNNLMTATAKRKSILDNEIAGLTAKLTGFEKVDLTRQFSKAMIGSTLLIIGGLLAALGVIDFDKDEDYMGAVLNVGALKIRLSDASPVSSSLILGSVLVNGFLQSNPNKKIESPLAAIVTTFLEDTPLNFLSDAIEYSDNVTEWFANIASNLITQYIPNVIKQTTKVFDHTKKMKSSDSWLRILENTADALPFVRNLLQNKIDPYTGETVKRGDAGYFGTMVTEFLYLISGAKIVYRNTTSIEAETKRLNVESSGASGRFSYKGKTYNLKKDYNQAELTEFKIYRGKYINDKLNKLLQSTSYKRATDKKKKELIKEVYNKASEYAKITWIKNNKKLLKK